MALTASQVLEMAPDAGSRKSGQDLAKASKWLTLGNEGELVWGEIQGSGKSPYRTTADFSAMTPAYKCSCPSRKFPCKHGLGMMLIRAQSPQAFATTPPPDWVAQWATSRNARAAAVAAPKPVDEAAQAKRRASRENKVGDGVSELKLWLHDLARRGLASVRSEPFAFFDRMAARLIDAQAPGLARRVRELGGAVAVPGDEAIEMIGRLALLLRAWERIDALPEDLAHDVRTAVGFPVGIDQLAGLPAVQDIWTVVAHQTDVTDETLKTRVVWLHGAQTGRYASFVDFAAGDRPWPIAPASGQAFQGGLAFYPGATALRSVIRGQTTSAIPQALPGKTLAAALDAAADALARVPWLDQVPLCLSNVRFGIIGRDAAAVAVGDDTGQALMLAEAASNIALVSAAGGACADVFGTWDGRRLSVLAMTCGTRRYAVTSQAGTALPVRRVA